MSQTALSFTRFLFLFLFFTASVKAQKEAKDFNVDSTLYAYYQRCQECLLQPVVLSMSDTLYRMAEERHDKRMQAVAISTQLDYHYFQATNEDSIIYYTNKVKDFAKATQQPKYYYFAWSKHKRKTTKPVCPAAITSCRRFIQSKDWIPWLSNGN